MDYLQAILEMEGVDTSEFTEEVLACLPPTPWQIKPEEIAKRKDLRSHRYFATPNSAMSNTAKTASESENTTTTTANNDQVCSLAQTDASNKL